MKQLNTTSILIVSIILVSLGRLHLSLVRHIDPDEFAYLHWTYLLATGHVPYRDFFLYHIPLFQFLMAPIFALPYSSFLIYLSRMWEFAVYALSVALLARIGIRFTRCLKTVLMTILIFQIFPMTVDKTVDIRPDTLMMLFYLISVLFALRESILSRKDYVLLGLSFGLSLLTFPKIIFALPSLGILLWLKHKSGTYTTRSLAILAVSAAIPFFLFGLYILSTGTLSQAVYLLTHGAWAVNAGKIAFSPWLALSPWPVIYVGAAGVSLPWLVNTTIWILAIPGLYLLWKTNRIAGIFLSVFFAFGIFFIFAFPAPYTQYFLPLSYFASLLAAVTIIAVARLSDRIFKIPVLPSSLIIFITCLLLVFSFRRQYSERVASNNREQMDVVDAVLTVSRPDETFYDMVGSYVFRPDGYIICCHPYAEFFHLLKIQVPTLRDSLLANKTKFVILDRTGQSFWKPLPEDLDFMFRHYIESPYKKIYVLGSKFFCSGGTCTQVNINNQPLTSGANTFDIIISENYLAETVPPDAGVTINGQLIGSSPFRLEPGKYLFDIPPTVTNLQIRLAR